jgi:hypothetical protein
MKFKAGLQRRLWLGTVWIGHTGNDEEDDHDVVLDALEAHWAKMIEHPGIKFAAGQVEVSDTGNLHIQCAVATIDSKRWGWMAKHLPAHWEPAADWNSVLEYVKKSDSRIKALPMYGTPPTVKTSSSKRGSLKLEAINLLKSGMDPGQIARKHPEVYFVHWRAINEMYKHVYISWASGKDHDGTGQDAISGKHDGP